MLYINLSVPNHLKLSNLLQSFFVVGIVRSPRYYAPTLFWFFFKAIIFMFYYMNNKSGQPCEKLYYIIAYFFLTLSPA